MILSVSRISKNKAVSTGQFSSTNTSAICISDSPSTKIQKYYLKKSLYMGQYNFTNNVKSVEYLKNKNNNESKNCIITAILIARPRFSLLLQSTKVKRNLLNLSKISTVNKYL